MKAERTHIGTSTQLYIQTLNLPQESFSAYKRCGKDCTNELFSPASSHKTAIFEALHKRVLIWFIKKVETNQIIHQLNF